MLHRMPRRRLAARTAIALMALATPFVIEPARAAWPPPESATPADLALPENWPNDPGYAWDRDGDGIEDGKGQWNYYSFMVPNSKVRPEEKATGMSIDMAWRLTTGDPRVLVAVTDSGIKWDEEDVIEAAYINLVEVQAYRPTREDGSACGDLDPLYHPGATPEQLAGFDCNGDGILSVGDWLETPTLLPAAGEGQVRGDRNRNGRLDAGDLILAFSDGVDDDQNGYVDDISGWDFMKDDNDPYDDTRYGHGTGEARDSTSRANNGIGTAGGCNQCRLINLRVGDSFITDVTDFAQAVIYAADMRAKVLQSALGTVNMNNYTQAALDYAWDKGMLTVASMADENARHHNMPTAANHTLPVHAIQQSDSKITESESFVDYHPCSNFGGQNFLSGSGNGCSSEAVGQTSGITGLVYSAGYKYGFDLSAGEVMQLLMMSADDIDVPESRTPEARYRWSHPGFDQRFGYGRVNANTAVEMVRDGKIPPVVDVVSPTWFSVLYKDQVTGPIDIQGSIRAGRAPAYDWVVEWAPGVQPLEGTYTTIAEQKNVPGDVVTGGSSPIASIDIRNIDTTHEADIDSPYGENRYTFTVRVRAVAHYGGAIGDVPGELRRTYYVHSDPDLVKGFPMWLGDSGETSPKMADIDGDGVRDIIYPTAGGLLHVLKITPEGPVPLPGFPFRSRRADGLHEVPGEPGEPSYLEAAAYKSGAIDPDIGRESMTTSAPAVADLDGDGTNEIIVATYAGTVYVVGNDGQVKDGWPKRLPKIPSCSLDPDVPDTGPCMSTESRIARGIFAAPVIEDMDQDGDWDIVIAGFDGKIHVWDGVSGDDVAGFPVEVRYDGKFGGIVPPANRIFTTPAVADFNGDGIPDLLVGSNQKLTDGGNAGAIYLVDGRGTDAPSLMLPNWPVTMTSFNLFPLVGEGIPNAGVVGMFGGTLAAVQHGNASLPFMLPADPGPQSGLGATPPNALPQRDDGITGLDPSNVFGELSTANTPNTMLPLFSQPALGDIDQDGVPDILSSGGSLSLAINLQSPSATSRGDNLLAMWSGKTGKMLPASPMTIEDFTFLNSSSVADLTDDGYPEVLIGSGGYYLHAFDGCGREPEGWPKFTGQWIIPTPAVGDLDGDGKLEVVVGTRNGWLYAWHTQGRSDGVIEWESYKHDNRNTGNHAAPLEQGGPSKATRPLTVEVCEELGGGDDDGGLTYYASGGCVCSLAEPTRDRSASGVFVAIGLAGLAIARRRQRRSAA